jgi:hypothetical protein
MPDWTGELLRPLYAEFGVPAVLRLDTGTFDDMAAMDMTAGATLDGGGVSLETVKPLALLIRGDLDERGILLEQLDDGSITLNGKSWTIKAHRMQPSTNGEADGEVALMLEAEPVF